MKSLTPKEKEIMKLLWAHGPMFIREMLPYYDEPRPHDNTVSTLVKLLIEKGNVTYQAFGDTFRYAARISKREYKGRAISELTGFCGIPSSPAHGLSASGTAPERYTTGTARRHHVVSDCKRHTAFLMGTIHRILRNGLYRPSATGSARTDAHRTPAHPSTTC